MRILLLLISVICCLQVEAKSFIVGAQNIHYYPHYDFHSNVDKGIGWAILEAYAEKSGHTFSYHAMPIVRLQRELVKGNVDFVYPDNPKWYDAPGKRAQKYYSLPLVRALGGTIVHPEDSNQPIDFVKRIAMPLGFTPVNWQQRVDTNQTKLITVNDSVTALQMLQKGRVNAANLEYNVVQYITSITPELGPFTLAPDLPHDDIGFMLSTIRHPGLVEDLSTFIKRNPDVMKTIYARYQLRLPQSILKSLREKQSQ